MFPATMDADVWARVDDGWWCHPKVLGLDLDARGLWVSALSWSCQQRTDVVPSAVVAMCRGTDEVAAKLVAGGMWEDLGGGDYRIHDWEDYQSDRAIKAAAGREGGRKSGEARRRKRHAEAPGDASGEASEVASSEAPGDASGEAGPAQPSPSQSKAKEPSGAGGENDADEARVVRTFGQFWRAYPTRQGKKVGKGRALQMWRKLGWEQRRRAYVGAVNLAKSGQLPKDAERFLRRDRAGEFPFDDWQDPASSDDPDYAAALEDLED